VNANIYLFPSYTTYVTRASVQCVCETALILLESYVNETQRCREKVTVTVIIAGGGPVYIHMEGYIPKGCVP
jgi:hypothetical protein